VERSVTTPGPGERFEWLRVSTLPLDGGAHRVDVRLGDGVGLDILRFVCRDPDPAASMLLLRDLGFQEKFSSDPVTAPFAAANLDTPYFRERMQSLLSSFFVSTGSGPFPWSPGPPPRTGVVLPPRPDISRRSCARRGDDPIRARGPHGARQKIPEDASRSGFSP
jgi:hypothetical protein